MKLNDKQIEAIEGQIVAAVESGIIAKGKAPRLMMGGAMATVEALGHEVPPIWSIWLMSGRDVYQEIKNKAARKADVITGAGNTENL